MTSLRVRRNWDFMTRRVQPEAAAAPVNTSRTTISAPQAVAPTPARLNYARPASTPEPAPTSSAGLRIGRADEPQPLATATRPIVPTSAALTVAPTLMEDVELTAAEPVVRLTRMQSSIGALRIDGAADTGWEASDRTAGISRGTAPLRGGPMHANRPLVERTAPTTVLVSARHLHDLRRIIVTPAGDALTLTTASGRTVTATGTLYLHRIGSIVELRTEPGTAVTDYGLNV